MNKSSLLIIRAGALGDTLMLMPSINALKKGHAITVMGRQPGISYLEPFIDQVIDIERGGWHRLFTGEVKSGLNLPHADYVAAFVAAPDNTISYSLEYLIPESRIYFFPPFPDGDLHTHVAVYMACALQSAGIPVDGRSAFNEALNKPVMQTHKISGEKIVLHPGSGSREKNYDPEFWSVLLSEIRKEETRGVSDICFLLGPAEEDIRESISKIAGEHDVEILICPEEKELLSILYRACLYIGHDNGITHLAAMLGLNTIALFKSSSIDRWRPVGPAVKVIGPDPGPDTILKKIIRECKGLLYKA